MKRDRIQEIKKVFLSKKRVTNTELCETFNVSIETVRRDLKLLEKEGFIHKVYGGARLAESTGVSPSIEAWNTRIDRNDLAKKTIAAAIADMIPNGCSVFLDTGTSVFEIVPFLKEKVNLTVLTNSIRVAQELGMCNNITVYFIGGIIKFDTLASTGFFATEFLSYFYHIDYAVFSCDGFLPGQGTTEFSFEVADVKKTVLEKVNHVIAAIDHTKIGIQGNCLCCPADKIGLVVVDSFIPPATLEALQKSGLNVVVAQPNAKKNAAN
ncbi:MAG: DeoR/GlpR transcriptional regulator [Oscillospiraceae bacterium]|nr:DeoR/GlpR transcriptional regulator [Oscillospiraceae bacterium]